MKIKERYWVLFVAVVFGVLVWLALTDDVQAAEIPDALAVRAILGEARGEGDKGMYAVACAIRNRGHLKGVYGLNAKMEPIPASLYQRAANAWHTSEYGPDPTKGASFWESVDFPRPYWAGIRKAQIGKHIFYEAKR